MKRSSSPLPEARSPQRSTSKSITAKAAVGNLACSRARAEAVPAADQLQGQGVKSRIVADQKGGSGGLGKLMQEAQDLAGAGEIEPLGMFDRESLP